MRKFNSTIRKYLNFLYSKERKKIKQAELEQYKKNYGVDYSKHFDNQNDDELQNCFKRVFNTEDGQKILHSLENTCLYSMPFAIENKDNIEKDALIRQGALILLNMMREYSSDQ